MFYLGRSRSMSLAADLSRHGRDERFWICFDVGHVSTGKRLRLRFGVGLLTKEVKFAGQIVGAVCQRL